MGHGTHHRDRSRTGASTAGHGRRLGGSRQPSAVHRRFRRQSRLGWGRVRTRGAERDRAPGVRSLRLAEAVHLRVSEPGAVQPSAGGGDPPQPGGDLAVAPRGAFKPAGRPPKGPVATQQGAWQSASTTTRSRPKSQASHTAKFYSGLLYTQSRTYTQRSGSSMFLNVLS